ncbi:serine/threonine-protein kinase pim-3-like [Mugil cephalus]|uniref:serine/threonine-protein kinase pim-3-like n=1 Tax=Mugil cephalus TaxID=48193 RepID=UPI001FB63E55|nr:serine/threonine-protein kinase pim-3-like [Mugil cephalus]
MVKAAKRKVSETGYRPCKRQRVSELDDRDEDTSSSKGTAEPKKRGTKESSAVKASRQDFESKYQQLNVVGEGGHGSVYAGYRRADNLPVAIKHIPRNNVLCKDISKKTRLLPLEVAVMKKLARGAGGKSAAIALLDYYDLDEKLILILERPDPCADLFQYIEDKGGSLPEEEARLVLKQLVEAGVELEEKNIFHRDIKLENILMATGSVVPRLRLIDFGLSCFTKKTSLFTIFCGTVAHILPEWYQRHTYRAGPSTVWQVGVVLYEMLHTHNRFETRKFLRNKVRISKELSHDCRDVLRQCLAIDPLRRPSLEQLRLHPWLN